MQIVSNSDFLVLTVSFHPEMFPIDSISPLIEDFFILLQHISSSDGSGYHYPQHHCCIPLVLFLPIKGAGSFKYYPP